MAQAAAPSLFDTTEYLSRSADPNPCVGMFGKGPQGKRCRTCVSLLKRGIGHSKTWYKCAQRRDPNRPGHMGGPATDHRVRWNACARYHEAEGSDG